MRSLTKQQVRFHLLLIFDIILINISFVSAYLLRFDGDLLSIPPDLFRMAAILQTAVIATLVKVICFALFKLYNSLWKYASIQELISVVTAVFIGNALMTCYIFINDIRPLSIFFISFFTDAFFVGGIRFTYRAFRWFLRCKLPKKNELKRVMVIGAGEAGAIVIKELKAHPELGSTPVVIIDNNPKKIGKKLNGVLVVGYSKEIRELAEKYNIDEIIITMPTATRKNPSELYTECLRTNCKVKILPTMSQLINGTVVMQTIREVSIDDLLGREPVDLDMDQIISYIKNRVIMVTGGGGSIGSELCRQIAFYGPGKLIILDNYENNAYDIQNELLASFPGLDIVTLIANIREKTRLDSIFKEYRPEVVFHAAAHKHVPLLEANPSEAIKNNVFGTLNVAQCADTYGVKRFVLISTDKAVNPTNIMGATKRIAEMIIQAINRQSKTEFVAVRFGNVLGSNGSVVPLFKKQIERGGPVTVTHPEIVRYFMTIPEAVQLVLQAGAMAEGGEIFVLDMGEPIKILDLAKNFIRLSGFEPGVDIKIKFIGLRPGEKLYEELLLEEEGLKKTRNNKIFVAKPLFTNYAMLLREINCLRNIICDNTDEVIRYIRTIVPTYKKAE